MSALNPVLQFAAPEHPNVQLLLRRPASAKSASKGQKVTARQQQVLELFSEGLTMKEVAAQLGISVTSIATHAARAYKKLGANNKINALRKLVEQQVLAEYQRCEGDQPRHAT
jgi:DNA-binding NarL/FixJ family response regulator